MRSRNFWDDAPLLLGYSRARPTQRRHSYPPQTTISSVGALRHASHGIEISITTVHISLVLLLQALMMMMITALSIALESCSGPPALAGLTPQRKAGISCPHLFSPSRLRIPSAHLVCSSRVIIHIKIVLVIVGSMLVIIVVTVVCILLINNTNVVIVVRVMNLITKSTDLVHIEIRLPANKRGP